MSNMNCRVKRAGLGVALLWGILGLILLLPTTVWAGGHTVKVPPPNGVDDTANIQGALNACVAYGPGCTVKLAAGKYLTKQVVIYNFQGTFKGMDIDSTTIEALPNLPVNWPDQTVASCQPNLTTCIWPSLFEFVEGNISVSDLTIKATAIPPTQPYVYAGSPLNDLYEGLGFTGQYPTYVSIDRIRMEGMPYSLGAFGYTVENGVHYSGDFPRSSAAYDYYFLSGSFTVRSSYFENVGLAISQDAFSTSSQITIGGSPSAGNHIENVLGGLDIEASEKSVFEISYNESSGTDAGMWVVPTWVPFVPSSPSWYFIHDNKFIGTGQNADGMYLYDDVTNPWIQAAVWNNTVRVKDILSEGMGAYNTKGTAIWNNRVTGTDGYDGIGLWSSTLSTVTGNHVSGFTVDNTVGYAQIYLDPSTTYDLVVCSNPHNTVLDQGTMNKVIGCQQSTASAEAATRTAPSATRPNFPRKKPQLP
jgi:hypothetical protein